MDIQINTQIMVHLLHNRIVIYKIEMHFKRWYSFFSVHPRKLQEGGKIINSQEVLGNLQLFNKITFGQQTQNGRTSDSNSNSNIFMAKTRKLLKAKGLSVLWPSQPTLSTHFGPPPPTIISPLAQCVYFVALKATRDRWHTDRYTCK